MSVIEIMNMIRENAPDLIQKAYENKREEVSGFLTSYGRIIRRLRKNSGLSLYEVSLRIGVPLNYIELIEGGYLLPDMKLEELLLSLYKESEEK